MNQIILIISGIYLFGMLFIPNIIFKKTEPIKQHNYVNHIEMQKSHEMYSFIFIIFNFLCFLFLNKIREHRKRDYYKKTVIFLDFWGVENLKDDFKTDYIKMDRYLKLKKLKI